MALKDYHDLLIELRSEDISYKDIAERLGYKRDNIKHYCQKNNIRATIDNSLETRTNNYIKTFNERFPDFEYISGYETYDSTIEVKCKECGHVQERHANNKDYMMCENCIELERQAKQAKLKQVQEHKEKQKLISKIIKTLNKRSEQINREPLLNKVCYRCGIEYVATYINSVHCDNCLDELRIEQESKARSLLDRTCKECGNKFNANNIRGYFCCNECKKKAINRVKEIDRRYRLKENGKVDYDISLKKLYKRDKGICHICGEKCNPKDIKLTEEGYYIAGRNYPSVDHVIPVAKGGTHTWGNVKLAHRYCNTIKSDTIIYKEKEGQLKIV